MYYKEDELKWL